MRVRDVVGRELVFGGLLRVVVVCCSSGVGVVVV